MKHQSIILLVLSAVVSAYAQRQDSSFSNQRQFLKDRDDLTGYIYLHLDEFLKKSTPENIYLLDKGYNSCWREANSDEERLALITLLTNQGFYLTSFGKLKKSIDAYEQAWDVYQQLTHADYDIIEYALKPLGNNYSRIGDYASAENIITLYLTQATQRGNLSHTIAAIINLSVVYHDTGRSKNAIDLLQQGLNIEGVSSYQKGLLYANLANNYLASQAIERAEDTAKKALSLLKKEPNDLAYQKASTLLASIKLRKGEIEAADEILKEQTQSNILDLPPREKARLLIQKAKVATQQSHEDEALVHYQKALRMLLPKMEPLNTSALPAPHQLYAENVFEEIFDGMAAIYFSQGNTSMVLTCYDYSFYVEDLLRGVYSYSNSKLIQQLQSRERTEKIITLLYDIYTQTKNGYYALKALQYAERSKSVLLKDIVSSQQHLNSSQEDSLLQDYNRLTAEMALLTSQIQNDRQKGQTNTYQLGEKLRRQHVVSLQIKKIKSILDKELSTYDLFAIHDQSSWIEPLQKELSEKNTLVIEFFVGKNEVFLFHLDGHAANFISLGDKTPLNDLIKRYLTLFVGESTINSDVNHYADLSFQLFTALQIPWSSSQKTMIIIPDGLLNFIPFETLLIRKAKTKDYRKMPYLFTETIIKYASTIQELEQAPIERPQDMNILGMFPNFKNSDKELTYAPKEAQFIKKKYQGTFLSNNHATKGVFIQNASSYNHIHLSTHAQGGSFLEDASIEFYDSTLTFTEIFGLRLNTYLIVLSACEAGIGQIWGGEGPLGLAQGFQYAGVEHMIYSLWKVNDQSTAWLMHHFYDTYTPFENIAEALHKAKLNYLSDPEIPLSKKSPYYWGAFVYYGKGIEEQQVQSVDSSWPTSILLWGIPCLILLILSGIAIDKYIKRRQ